MNVAQKIVTGISLLAIILTLLNSPWQRDYTTQSLMTNIPVVVTHLEYSPIWDPPFGGNVSTSLNIGVLIVWWAAIFIIYGLGMLLTAKRNKPLDSVGHTSTR